MEPLVCVWCLQKLTLHSDRQMDDQPVTILSPPVLQIYNKIFYDLCLNNTIQHRYLHKVGCQPGDYFNLRSLCGYVWVNILTLSPQGVLLGERRKKETDNACCLN